MDDAPIPTSRQLPRDDVPIRTSASPATAAMNDDNNDDAPLSAAAKRIAARREAKAKGVAASSDDIPIKAPSSAFGAVDDEPLAGSGSNSEQGSFGKRPPLKSRPAKAARQPLTDDNNDDINDAAAAIPAKRPTLKTRAKKPATTPPMNPDDIPIGGNKANANANNIDGGDEPEIIVPKAAYDLDAALASANPFGNTKSKMMRSGSGGVDDQPLRRIPPPVSIVQPPPVLDQPPASPPLPTKANDTTRGISSAAAAAAMDHSISGTAPSGVGKNTKGDALAFGDDDDILNTESTTAPAKRKPPALGTRKPAATSGLAAAKAKAAAAKRAATATTDDDTLISEGKRTSTVSGDERPLGRGATATTMDNTTNEGQLNNTGEDVAIPRGAYNIDFEAANPFGNTKGKSRMMNDDAPITARPALVQPPTAAGDGEDDAAPSNNKPAPKRPVLRSRPTTAKKAAAAATAVASNDDKPIGGQGEGAPSSAEGGDQPVPVGVYNVDFDMDDPFGAKRGGKIPGAMPGVRASMPTSASAPAAAASVDDGAPPSTIEEKFDGPLEARLVHDSWKARQQAYTELKMIIDGAPEKAIVLREYAPLFPSLCKENQPACIEPALSCVLTTIAAAGQHLDSSLPSELINGLVQALKGRGKNKAMEIIGLLFHFGHSTV
jgi:hypothetical protein